MKEQKVTRREFLKNAAAGLALGMAGVPSLLEARDEPDLVVISGEPAAATKKALEAMGGISRFVKKGQRVAIKPNMSFARPPEAGANTHPQVVATVARACIEAGAERVVVMDHTLARPEFSLELSGIKRACQGIKGVYVLGVEERKFFREIRVPQGKVFEKIEVFGELLESHVLINLPVAKTHGTTGVTLGIKCLMGLIWDRQSFHYRYDINQALADLAMTIRPQLTILDATRALVTGGPGGPGKVQKPNLVIAGTDPVAVDSYGVTVAPWYGQNFKGRQVEHLLLAHERGLGEIDVEKLKIFEGSA